ncbi:DUF1214 domain-containing protein [Mesorhizobium sp. M2C.T.Ca.TU.002.02.1.1]|jgi:hypothetical protein|uniref:DUF1214 domain-containing protein n=1 Tax=Mesorhizobium plurifarium TaxID=69974 RepID=A0A090GA41_MESPL|nr:DUF1214 domain-containing protein [Mesorhizobium sp. M2C.T.Ca.TU.002.02.1.1]RUU58976.1 DUF1214 domain-containing protein [Mesorhizobium sp. M2C.T.Ca.TU.009.01.2.1]CDX46320.1 conserved exported hypothetical protein [Mesorhizobium plurifarium]RUU58180.1 DUF1214 domain-containing protein [Mesorhizobium sp. M2C.T.Ca.TU.002.02.1.1]CDX55715.1 conserved exported hypothetical protein [Mesorhizobium plurifarium]CDX55761.1 conserved exported hypothetical protein [Mesorhizobium plurifarium]
MLKNAILTLLSLAIAIGLGGYSVWYALNAQDGVGAIRIGQWTAFPEVGTLAADPYSKARVAREGVLALGQAEGLAFVAERDDAGEPLKRECTYTIEGGYPTARFWTLYAADQSLGVIDTGKPRQSALQSYDMLRRPDNSVVISVGSRPAPGNWLLTGGSGKMYFVLTFYDTPIASSTGLSDVTLPRILKAGCNA